LSGTVTSVDSYGERRYFELGRDAAIEYGYRDLRFVNLHELPLHLEVTVDAERVRAALWAPRELGADVRIEVSEPAHSDIPAPVITLDEALPAGVEFVETHAIQGLRVSTTRIVRTADGTEVREHLGESVHLSRPAVIRRGPG
jgi:vancomycin resistance protein YoaR